MFRPLKNPAVVCGSALAAVLVGGCAGPEGLRVEGSALQPSKVTGPVYVADAMGQPLRRPTSVGLTEFVTVTGLSWRDWGGPTARATGRLGGEWCLPGCADKPYEATLTLSGLERQERVAYYRRATVEPKKPEELPAAAVNVQFQGIRLSVPEF
ncbi:hypothetical protein [Streptomyces kanamyceticus]|uniref:Lipoprotein n=1 Tax=Streptomyces kanamyceticus TaxID=1967 RepID=A0A5J6GH52_STRKN|nr:hypothetical protein [Streptomyces kanamyceticus]QEU93804.1 hypothetical protein CP970_25470 [Streptomyces kanamyceticus]